MSKREEINLEDAAKVVGGAYVTTSMSIGQIIQTDPHMASILAQAGIPVTGNKRMMSASLQEIAEVRGVNATVIENRMNEYLGGK